MTWHVDNRIATTTFKVTDFSLSRLYLKNDANYLWFILIPRVENIQEIHQLSTPQRVLLIEEIAALSDLVNKSCKPFKMNVGALGNIVTQLHIHVIARHPNDPAWPHGVWQETSVTKPYKKEEVVNLLKKWRSLTKDLNLGS